jgi:hypothetical protein
VRTLAEVSSDCSVTLCDGLGSVAERILAVGRRTLKKVLG